MESNYFLKNELENSNYDFESVYNAVFSNYSNRTFVEFSSENKFEKMTYYEYSCLIETVARRLSAKINNYKKGSWVSFKYESCHLWLAVFWALLKLGYNVLLLDPKYNSEMTIHKMEQSNSKFIITAGKEELPDSLFKVNFEDLFNKDAEESDYTEDWSNHIAMCTSGTTDISKIFIYSGKEIVYEVFACYGVHRKFDLLLDENGDKAMIVLPLHHVFGLMITMVGFTCGFVFVYPKNNTPSSVMDASISCGVTWMSSIPMLWDYLVKSLLYNIKKLGEEAVRDFYNNVELSLEKQKEDFIQGSIYARTVLFKDCVSNLLGTKVRVCLSGGGTPSAETMKIMTALGYGILNGYGTTETGVVMGAVYNEIEDRLSGTLGYMFPNSDFSILLNSGKDEEIISKAPGSIGELLIKARCMHIGQIVNKEILPAKVDSNGWYHSGDIAEFDGKYIRLVGRSSNIIINESGENIYPEEIEMYFDSLPYTEYVVVVGLKDETGSEKVSLIVQIDSDLNDTYMINAIVDKFNDIMSRMPMAKRVRTLIMLEKGSISSNFKINRNNLAEKIMNNEYVFKTVNFRAILEKTTPSYYDCDDIDLHLKNEIREIVLKTANLSDDELNDNTHLMDDLGIQSLVMMEIFINLSEKYGINIEEDEYNNFMVFNDIVRQVSSRVQRANSGSVVNNA